jgi:hypothetical protein
MKKTLFPIVALVLALGLALLVAVPVLAAASIWTDKADYATYETVIINGSGFLQTAEVTVTIIAPDATEDTVSPSPLTDGTGDFTCTYKLNGIIGTYTVTATDGTNTATTTFTEQPAFTATIDPTSASSGETKTYIITITNDPLTSAGTSLGSAIVEIPTGFTSVPIILNSVVASAGKSWTGTIDSGDSGQIKLHAVTTHEKLPPNEYVSVSFSATAPATADIYEWTTTAYVNIDWGGVAFRLNGLQPTVTVTAPSNQPPNKPSNISPANGATGISLTPTLQSSAFSDPDPGDTHATSQWQITTPPGDYSSPVFDSDTDATNLTSITIPSGNLNYNATYYWHVRHQDNHGAWSSYSNETYFTTQSAPNQPPNQPSNISPANGATGISLTPTLQSSAFSDPDPGDTHAASQWQIRTTSGDYSSPVFDSGTDATNLTSITIPSGNLNYNTTYYWHVMHQDNLGAWSSYSNETSFTTQAAPPPTPTPPPPPTPTPPPVGGTIIPTDKLGLVMPWIMAAALIVVGGVSLAIWNKKRGTERASRR